MALLSTRPGRFSPLLAVILILAPLLSAFAQEPFILWSDGKIDKGVEEYELVPAEYVMDAGKDGMTFRLYVTDAPGAGFRAGALGTERLDRLADAFDYVADVLNETGQVDVVLGSTAPGVTAIAQGGPLFTLTPGLTGGAVFDRVTTSTKPFSGYAEMGLFFNWSGFSWYTGTGTTDADKIDLISVALHEITHALGFISLMKSNGQGASGTYTIFDGFLAKSDGTNVISGIPPVFSVLAADLTGNGLVFEGASARLAYGGVNPPIVSANPFLPGTSLQHWRTGTITGSHVMEPAYSNGMMKRTYSTVDIGVLDDIGWVNVDAVAAPPCPLAAVVITSPTGEVSASAMPANVPLSATVSFNNTGSCTNPGAGGVQVEYFVDDVPRGVSINQAGQFPLTVPVTAGSHTLRAEATLLATSQKVQAQKTIQVTEKDPVPNVAGLTQAAAATAITGAGMTLGTVTQQFHGTIPAGQVISQNPAAGTLAVPGTAVSIVVSNGLSSVPAVVGLTEAAATAQITAASLAVGVVAGQFSDTIPQGQVMGQNPAGGTPAAPGTLVSLVISMGVPITVPNVTGQAQSAAASAISSAGLTVGTVTEQFSDTVPEGQVISQTPAAGAQAAAGSAVNLTVSKGEAPPATVPVPNVIGQTQSAAQGMLSSAGLTAGNVTEAFSDEAPAGVVTGQNPAAAAQVAPGTPVALVVSKGPEEGEAGGGCSCGGKSLFTVEEIKKRLGDLFLAGMALMVLTVMGRGARV